MFDLLYVLATVGFFALMLWFVAGCQRLGRRTSSMSSLDEP